MLPMVVCRHLFGSPASTSYAIFVVFRNSKRKKAVNWNTKKFTNNFGEKLELKNCKNRSIAWWSIKRFHRGVKRENFSLLMLVGSIRVPDMVSQITTKLDRFYDVLICFIFRLIILMMGPIRELFNFPFNWWVSYWVPFVMEI